MGLVSCREASACLIRTSPVGYIHANCEASDQSPSSFFCNIVWPHYEVDSEEVRPVNGTVEFNAFLPAAPPAFPFPWK